ncbi:MAG: hypothetical protein A2X20_00290 [Bacteroidetes bacterium GWE2_40_15]|nr:MAG: hypothetical protein A2X20_00290 [Bacteroidetes bacterium GWE2_40_15]
MKLGEKSKISVLVIGFILFLGTIILFLGKGVEFSDQLKESLITELIGAGFITLFVSLAMILIQHLFAVNVEKIRAKREALVWIDSILEPEFQSELQKGATPWEMGEREGATFYFHNTPINNVYKLIVRHYENIVKSAEPSDSMFLMCLLEFKQIADDALALANKIDLELKNKVRTFNKARNAISANDGSLFVYVRAKKFSNLTDEQILNYVEFGSNQTRTEFMNTLDNSIVEAWQEKLARYKNSLNGALYKMGHRKERE